MAFYGLLLQQGAPAQLMRVGYLNRGEHIFSQLGQLLMLSCASEIYVTQSLGMMLLALWNSVLGILWPFASAGCTSTVDESGCFEQRRVSLLTTWAALAVFCIQILFP